MLLIEPSLVSITEKDCVYYSVGDSTPVIIDCPHAAGSPAVADELTAEIAESVCQQTGAGMVVSMVPRDVADLNRHIDYSNGISTMAHRQQRDAIHMILHRKHLLKCSGFLKQPALLISLHGMKGYSIDGIGQVGMEIGTRRGMLCDEETAELMKYNLQHHLQRNVVIDKKYIGSQCLLEHIYGDGRAYAGYGLDLQIVQLEISRDLRFRNFTRTADALVKFVRLFRAHACQIHSDTETACC